MVSFKVPDEKVNGAAKDEGGGEKEEEGEAKGNGGGEKDAGDATKKGEAAETLKGEGAASKKGKGSPGLPLKAEDAGEASKKGVGNLGLSPKTEGAGEASTSGESAEKAEDEEAGEWTAKNAAGKIYLARYGSLIEDYKVSGGSSRAPVLVFWQRACLPPILSRRTFADELPLYVSRPFPLSVYVCLRPGPHCFR